MAGNVKSQPASATRALANHRWWHVAAGLVLLTLLGILHSHWGAIPFVKLILFWVAILAIGCLFDDRR